MQEKDSVLALVMSVAAVNLMMLVVVVYWINPIDLPTPADDVAVSVGAYYLAEKTGLLSRVLAILDAIRGELENTINGPDTKA